MIRKVLMVLIASFGLAGSAFAQTCASYSYTLTNGTTADASQVMSNFNAVRNCVNALASGGTFVTPNIGVATGTSLTLSAPVGLNIQPATGTNYAVMEFINTGGEYDFGVDNSTGSIFNNGSYGLNLSRPAGKVFSLNRGGTSDFKVDGSGAVSIPGTTSANGGLLRGIATETTATRTVAATDTHIIANRAGTITLTLPTASSFTGRELTVRTITANTVVSNASNVIPCVGGSAGTAILAATAGKWALLVSDGTNWQTQMCN